MDTAPVPNIMPIPGMNQGEIVAGGGGENANADGSADEAGDDKENAGDGKDGKDADGDGRDAESDPIDVMTGRVFTLPVTDLDLPGPLPLFFERTYSSIATHTEQGLGLGWAHSFGWYVEVRRERVRVWNESGVFVSFETPQIGHTALGDHGWLLRRDISGFSVDAGDEVWRTFSVTFDEGETYRLTGIEDRNKNRIAINYDAAGTITHVVDSAGRTVRFTTKDRRIASIDVQNGPGGRSIAFARYDYDAGGRLVRVTDADDHSWTYEYDEFHRLTCHTDRNGLSFMFRYDTKDRGVEAWGEYRGKRDISLDPDLPKFLADGRTRAKGILHRKIEHHPRGFTEVTDSTETRRYFGNKRGQVEKAVFGGSVLTAKYDERGFLVERTNAIEATWRWVVDERGKVLEAIDPLERRTVITRNASGLAERIVGPDGSVTQIGYDRHGNVELVRSPSGATTAFTYDERGLMTGTVDPMGASTTFAYDAHGNLVSILEPNGGAWAFAYDGLGRRLLEKDPAGAETRYEYTDRGDLVSVRDANGGLTRYAYDGEQHVTQVTTPLGRVTRYVWGGHDKLCARINANDQSVRLAYNREGELLTVTNQAGEVHRMHLDTAGRLVGEETFDGRILRYRNDGAGHVLRVEHGSEITQMSYDRLGQLLKRELPDGGEETFAYDPCGRITAATNAAGEFRFERDVEGRIVREFQRVGAEEHWLEGTFDPRGFRVSRRSSLAFEERIQRDVVGSRSISWLDDHRVEHANDVLGREVARRLPGRGVIETAYDLLGRLERRTVRDPSAARSTAAGEPQWVGRRDDGVTSMTSYVYDADGGLSSTLDRARGHTRYEYDPIGQIVAAVPEKVRAEVFRYGPTGNLLEADGTERTYGKGGRLLRNGTTEYEWSEEGRLRTKRELTDRGPVSWHYSWDGAGMLSEVETPEGLRVRFSYDPFGRRVEKQVAEADGTAWKTRSRTRFVWDREVLAHEIRYAASETGERVVEEKTYVFEDGSFSPMAHRDGRGQSAEWFQYVNDTCGTPDRLVDGNGAVACELERSTWTMRVAPGGRTTTPIRFEGQQADDDVGLIYNRFRYFDPSAVRFISSDPLGIDGTLNAFAYTKNPFAWTDPFGCDWNYRLTDSSGNPYYYGRASDNQSPADVMRRHTKSGRMDDDDKLEQLSPKGTDYDKVRGIEQKGIETGGPGGTSTLRTCKKDKKKNRINGINPDKKNSPKKEVADLAKAREKAGDDFMKANSPTGKAADLPALSTHDPADPRATSSSWK